jgi:hypothetical protein
VESRSRDQREGEDTLSQVVKAEIAATYRKFAAGSRVEWLAA